MKRIFLLLSTCLMLQSVAIAQPPVAIFNFNNTLADATGGASGIPSTGYSPLYVSGSPYTGSAANTAIQLASGNYIQIPYSSLLNNPTWTISAIVRMTSNNSGGSTQIIVERYGSGLYGNEYMSLEIYNKSGGGDKIYGSASAPNFNTNYGAPPAMPLNQWTCITVTYDGFNVRTYVGGVLQNTHAWSNTYPSSWPSSNLYIGSTSGRGFIGQIDDIRIYGYAQSQGQITCNFPNPATPWVTTGNNTATNPGNIFGTTNADDVLIQTSGVQRGMIHRSGLFGIGTGTATPTATLHVNASGNGVRLQSLPSATTAHTQAIVADGNGNLAVTPHTIDWALVGNSVTLNDYFGSTNAADVNIKTQNIHMGRFEKGGNFDIGDPTIVVPPFFAVHPNSYNSSRYCAAFGTNSTINATSGSIALGVNHTLTSASGSFSAGAGNQLTNTLQSIAVGEGNHLTSSWNSSATGNVNDISNGTDNSQAVGFDNALDASDNSTASGSQNQLTSQAAALVAGESNILTGIPGLTGISNMALGSNNQLLFTQRSSAMGNHNQFNNNLSSVAIGNRNTVDNGGNESFAIGNDSKIHPASNQSFAIGNNVTAAGLNVHTYGQNIDNTAGNSLAIGFNNVRTLTVTDIGVGIKVSNVTNYVPTHNLEVDAASSTPNTSNIAFLNLPTASNLPAVLVDPATGELFMSQQQYSIAGNGGGNGDANEEQIQTLVQAVKVQQAENDELKARLAAYDQKFALLEKTIAGICESGCAGLTGSLKGTPSTDGVTADKLYQSIPNPTDGRAIINYFLSRDYEQASIVITSADGRAMQTISVSPKAGQGTTTVELGAFASQTYAYTLYVNGQKVESKKLTVIK